MSDMDPDDPTPGCTLVLLLCVLVAMLFWLWLGPDPVTGLAGLLPWAAIPAGGWLLYRRESTRGLLPGWIIGSLATVMLVLVLQARIECAYDAQWVLRATGVSTRCEQARVGPRWEPTRSANCPLAASRLNQLAASGQDGNARRLIEGLSRTNPDYPRPSAVYSCDGDTLVLRPGLPAP